MRSLEELLLKWQDHSISQEELGELNALLRQPEARARLWHQFQWDAQIAQALEAEQARVRTQQQAQAYETLEVTQADDGALVQGKAAWQDVIRSWAVASRNLLLAPFRGFPAFRSLDEPLQTACGCERTWFWRWKVALAAGVILPVLAGLFLFFMGNSGLAKLEGDLRHVEVMRGSETIRAPRPGLALKAGDEVRASMDSVVTITYRGEDTRLKANTGAWVVLDPDQEGKRLKLLQGALTVVVAPQPLAQPMVILTPHAEVQVLGTEFSLGVNAHSSRLDVLTGSVRFARNEDDKSVVVHGGYYAVAGRGWDFAAHPLLPAPWSSQDIGLVGRPGHARFEGKKCKVAGGGHERGRDRDEFHFVYQILHGDGEIQARVVDFELKDKKAKAGVMIRGGLKSTAPAATLSVKAGRGLEFGRRFKSENMIESVGQEAAPFWVRLIREGDRITAYKSPDGEKWTLTGRAQFSQAPQIYVGLGVTSSDKSSLNTAVFDNISIIAAMKKNYE